MILYHQMAQSCLCAIFVSMSISSNMKLYIDCWTQEHTTVTTCIRYVIEQVSQHFRIERIGFYEPRLYLGSYRQMMVKEVSNFLKMRPLVA